MGLLSKVRQDSGKKKGIKRFYLPNSLIFSVARAGHDPATFPILHRDALTNGATRKQKRSPHSGMTFFRSEGGA